MEVLLAIAIVAIIAGPLLQTFVTSTAVGRRSYDTDKANTVSVRTVEEIKGAPSSINTSGYSYDESYDSSLGKYIHTFTRTQYYDTNWNGPYDTDLGGTCPFREVITAQGEEDAASDLDGLSYIPELVAASGQNYRLEVDYGSMTSNSYLITVTKDDTQYTVGTSEGILKSTLTGASGFSQSIPLEDCISGVLPIVVLVGDVEDVGNPPTKSFTVDNRTGKELGLYIYGDYRDPDNNDPHYVTATLTSGVMTVNYMKVSSATLSYDKLDLNVTVYRESDGVRITDYTTLLYLSQ